MPAYRNSAQIDMTHGSVLGRAALFALPICAGNILQLLYSTVDTLVIGNFCDTTALASVATSSQPLEILLCVFVGIGSGISILVSQAVGRGDRDQLQKLVRTSVWLLFAASLPLTVIGLLLGPWMLRLMQVPADAMPGAVLYLRITMLGILGNMGYNFNAGLLRGLGNSSSSLQLLFISCAAEYRAGSCTYRRARSWHRRRGSCHGDCAVFVVDMQHFLHSPPLHRACAACFSLRL